MFVHLLYFDRMLIDREDHMLMGVCASNASAHDLAQSFGFTENEYRIEAKRLYGFVSL